jgi:coproporphyrinogen III oxidase-like Fe-S oxidoreductase
MTVCGRGRRPRLQLEPRETLSKPPSQHWQNVCDYRAYTDRVLTGRSPRGFRENLTNEMKRTERITLSLRMREGVAGSELKHFGQETEEFISLGLLRKSGGNLVLTPKSKELADSVAEAFL